MEAPRTSPAADSVATTSALRSSVVPVGTARATPPRSEDML